jgi:hypothetical protein
MLRGLNYHRLVEQDKFYRESRQREEERESQRMDMERKRFDALMQKNEMELADLKESKERKKYIESLYRGLGALESGDFSGVSSDDVDRVFKGWVNQGSSEGESKRFVRFVPSEHGKGFHAEVEVTRGDGKKEIKPVTVNRSSDPQDPVATFRATDFFNDAKAKQMVLKKMAYEMAAAGDPTLLNEIHEREAKMAEANAELAKEDREFRRDKQLKRLEHRFRMREQNAKGEGIDLQTGTGGELYRVPKRFGAKAERVQGPEGGLTVRPSGSTPTYSDIEVPKWLVQIGAAPDLKTAYALHNSGDIRATAMRAAIQAKGDIYNAEARGKPLDQLYREMLGVMQAEQGGGAPGGAAPGVAGAARTPPPGVVTATNPQTGQKIYLDPQSGTWVPMQ